MTKDEIVAVINARRENANLRCKAANALLVKAQEKGDAENALYWSRAYDTRLAAWSELDSLVCEIGESQ